MDDIPPRSYGPLIETTMRIVTWNVWACTGHGESAKRQSWRRCKMPIQT